MQLFVRRRAVLNESLLWNTSFPFLRESSFNMTRRGGGGDEDIETRSFKF